MSDSQASFQGLLQRVRGAVTRAPCSPLNPKKTPKLLDQCTTVTTPTAIKALTVWQNTRENGHAICSVNDIHQATGLVPAAGDHLADGAHDAKRRQSADPGDLGSAAAAPWRANRFRLLDLPQELHLLLIDHLPFDDMVRLRRTCRFYYYLATPEVVQSVVGQQRLTAGLLSHCRVCLFHDPSRLRLLLHSNEKDDEANSDSNSSSPTSDSYSTSVIASEAEEQAILRRRSDSAASSTSAPEAPAPAPAATTTSTQPTPSPQPECSLLPRTRCITCSLYAHDARIRPGRRVELASLASAWVCRWCGWPVVGTSGGDDAPAFGRVQFHRSCYGRYGRVMGRFFTLGWAQFALGVAGAVVARRGFAQDGWVVGVPALTGFTLSWLCLGLIAVRHSRSRSYQWSLLAELEVMALYIPPAAHVGRLLLDAAADGPPASSATWWAFSLFGLNVAFRVLNVLGNVVLLCGYDLTRHHMPDVPAWRKYLLNPPMAFLIYWTYPQAIEQNDVHH